MKILLDYLKRYRNWVFITFFLAVVNQLFSLLDPFCYGKLIDLATRHKELHNAQDYILSILKWIGLAVGVAMVSRVAKAFQDYFLSKVILKFGADVYTDGLRHSLQLPFQEFEDQRSGSTLNILQRVRTDTEKFMTSFLNVFFFGIVGIVFVLVYSFSVYGPLSLIYFVACFSLFAVIKVLSERIKAVQTVIVSKTNILAGATTESLRNIELIKSLGLINQEVERLNSSTNKILELELQKVKSIRAIAFIQGTMVNMLRQGILFVLLYLIFKEYLTLGQLTTLQMYSFFIFNPLQEMGNVILSYREAEASLNNFRTLMSKAVEAIPLHPVALESMDTIAFEHVQFAHRSAKTNAVEQISFTIKKGETIAFVGPSGSGKTTLVKLLVGLYKPSEGQITINGHNINDMDFNEQRAKIGLVSQDTQLFAGTIRENLLFVNPTATEAQLMDVLQKASCTKLLARSDKGLDTVIGEGGMKVSGGEKQRLSIARSLLRNPDLLIFDEATSALDSITEDEITQTIRNVSAREDRITIMIAHRLSTIMHADTIYVLEKGKIIEQGKHQDLLDLKGLYYAMWRQQIGERKA